jgi:hypothetical protein
MVESVAPFRHRLLTYALITAVRLLWPVGMLILLAAQTVWYILEQTRSCPPIPIDAGSRPDGLLFTYSQCPLPVCGQPVPSV